METTITLQQQREMLINEIAQFKAEGKEIDLHNAQCDLRKLDESKSTGLKCKDFDGQVYETFSYYYVSQVTGGKKWKQAYFCSTQLGSMERNPYKKECFK